jgi:OmpA-OmpF porin, OOP family
MANMHGWAMIPVAWLALTGTGWAQSNPSAEELINALKPGAVSLQPSPGRGLHRVEQPSEETPARAPGGGLSMQAVMSESQMTSTNADLPSASLFIQFSTGSAGLTPQAVAVLDELGKALASNALASYRFRVEGHTDTVGAKDYNRVLSERRAAAVVAYIRRKFGIDEGRMVPVGLGSEQLLVQTADQTPEARNRRVKIVNIGT